eukprot:Sdes_comp13540_c0_seq1m3221
MPGDCHNFILENSHFPIELRTVLEKHNRLQPKDVLDFRWKEFQLGKYLRPTHSKHYGERPSYLAWRKWSLQSAEKAEKIKDIAFQQKLHEEKEAHLRRLNELRAVKYKLENPDSSELSNPKNLSPLNIGSSTADASKSAGLAENGREVAKRIDNVIWRAWYQQKHRLSSSSSTSETSSQHDAEDYSKIISLSKLDELLVDQMEGIQMGMFSSVPELESFISKLSKDLDYKEQPPSFTERKPAQNELDSLPLPEEGSKDLQSMFFSQDSCEMKENDEQSKMEDYAEQRRNAHILAEQKRRNNIKSGFEDLKNILPNCPKSAPPQSFTKAAILQKAIDYTLHLQKAKAIAEEKLDSLRRESLSLKLLHMKLLETQAAQISSGQVKMTSSTISQSLPEMIKFIVFRNICEKLFQSFNDSISLQSFEQMCSSIFSWLRTFAKPSDFRDIALTSLRDMGEKYFVASHLEAPPTLQPPSKGLLPLCHDPSFSPAPTPAGITPFVAPVSFSLMNPYHASQAPSSSSFIMNPSLNFPPTCGASPSLSSSSLDVSTSNPPEFSPYFSPNSKDWVFTDSVSHINQSNSSSPSSSSSHPHRRHLKCEQPRD